MSSQIYSLVFSLVVYYEIIILKFVFFIENIGIIKLILFICCKGKMIVFANVFIIGYEKQNKIEKDSNNKKERGFKLSLRLVILELELFGF